MDDEHELVVLESEPGRGEDNNMENMNSSSSNNNNNMSRHGASTSAANHSEMEIFEESEREPDQDQSSTTTSTSISNTSTSRPMTATKSKSKIPDVVQACYKNFKQTVKGRTAECKQCRKTYSDGVASTSNFVRHIRCKDHFKSWKAYQDFLKSQRPTSSSTLPISMYMTEKKFSPQDAHQKAIRDAVVKFVVNANQAVTIVDHPDFRYMMSTAQPKYSPICRQTVTEQVTKQYVAGQKMLKKRLSQVSNVSLTLDIWSDRRTRGYLGITAHYHDGGEQLCTSLLSCQRITGSHTGSHIKEEFDLVLSEYDLHGKVAYIVTDNASNMRKAFSVNLVTSEEESTEEEDVDAIWEDLDQEEVDEIVSVAAISVPIRCFAHSLQLAVGDGLKDTRILYGALGKCSKIASLLHTTTAVQEAFEKKLGKQHSIPQPNSTRWNSTLNHVKGVLKHGIQTINEVFTSTNHTNLRMNAREGSMLEELIALLSPFAEATVQTQGDKSTTISYVLPCVLMIYRSLEQMTLNYLFNMRRSLMTSMKKRFAGLLDRDNFGRDTQEPFSNDVYLISTVLDPNWGFAFLEWFYGEDDIVVIKEKVQEILRKSMPDNMPDNMTTTEPENENASITTSSLFAEFRSTKCQEKLTMSQEISHIMAIERRVCNPMLWWQDTSKLVRAKPFAQRILTAPATSAPIERVFSQSGLILRQHRASMDDSTLQKLLFLKCNSITLQKE